MKAVNNAMSQVNFVKEKAASLASNLNNPLENTVADLLKSTCQDSPGAWAKSGSKPLIISPKWLLRSLLKTRNKAQWTGFPKSKSVLCGPLSQRTNSCFGLMRRRLKSSK